MVFQCSIFSHFRASRISAPHGLPDLLDRSSAARCHAARYDSVLQSILLTHEPSSSASSPSLPTVIHPFGIRGHPRPWPGRGLDCGMNWFAAYVAAGAVIGILAGMLGIGGGMTLVPVLAAL